MFLQVWPSGSSHEEAHLERGEQQPSNAAKGKVFKGKRKKKNKRRLPTSLLVELSQSRVAGVCSSQSMPFCTILKPSASGTSLWRKALWRLSVATRGQNHGCGRNRFDWEGLTHKKTKKRKKKDKLKEWMICVYGAWCFGNISRTADTLVLYKTVWGEHVCTVNVWDWLTGPQEREKKILLLLGEEDGLMDGAGLAPMLLWTEWVSGGSVPLVFPLVAVWGWGRMVVPACLSGTRTEGGGGLSNAFEALGSTREREGKLVCDPGIKIPSPVTVWQELFLVFLVQLLNVQCVM